MNASQKTVWIDLDNSPHVPFFRPIVDRLQRQGYRVWLTARDAYNVTELIRLHRLECKVVGRHFGRNKLMKVLGLVVRALELLPHVLRNRPQLAVSHGSRAQMLAARLMQIPSLVIADYEHVTHLTRPDCMVLPEVIPAEVANKLCGRVRSYPGIKEDVYAATFAPDPALLGQLGLGPDDVVVTVRPPASEAHYHSPQSDALFAAAMKVLSQHPNARVVLLPRNEQQKAKLVKQYAQALQEHKFIIPNSAVDGLNLVWHSDLVISGGGTMNREAAALGVPVYSVFRGPLGAVDRYLASKGRLVLLESADEVPSRLVVAKRAKSASRASACTASLDAIVSHIVAETHLDEPATDHLRGERT
jgi:uncharacterized protein